MNFKYKLSKVFVDGKEVTTELSNEIGELHELAFDVIRLIGVRKVLIRRTSNNEILFRLSVEYLKNPY